jgi:large subunit ribosomal protein L35
MRTRARFFFYNLWFCPLQQCGGLREVRLVGVPCREVTEGHQDATRCSRRLSAQLKRSINMPKMKTKSSAKKRFRVRPGGTVKRGQAFKRHILTKKSTKNKRQLRGAVNVHETNMGHMAQMLPFAGL